MPAESFMSAESSVPAERHVDLPVAPNLEYYRKQAKELHRAVEAGDTDSAQRVVDVLGSRTYERFLLADAQFVLAQEHGFRAWADFVHAIEMRTEPDVPVRRIGEGGEAAYEAWAQALLGRLRAGSTDALQRFRTHVARFVGADNVVEVAAIRDARLVVARELGFRTWRELSSFTRTSGALRTDPRGDRAQLLQLWREGTSDGMRRVVLAQPDPAATADRLLCFIAQHEPFAGVHLGNDLGTHTADVDVLIALATDLDTPLQVAARHNRGEYVRHLLDAGAAIDATSMWGVTPLEVAIYHGSVQAIDSLASHTIVPWALWTVAACGDVDLVRTCFDMHGQPLPEATAHRPSPTGDGWPPRPPARDDVAEILAEAFVHACQSGRIEVIEWFLANGIDPDRAAYYGMTGLHYAIAQGFLAVVRLLVGRGATVRLRDERFDGDAYGWALHFLEQYPDDVDRRAIHDLLRTYGGKA
jgi:hypothetical protein